MSQNVIYDGSPYHLIYVDGHEVVLKPVQEGEARPIRVEVMAPTLIIDPTDDEWSAVRRPIRQPT